MLSALAATTPPAWLSGWLGVAVAAIGFLGIVAGTAAYLRAGYAKATVQTLSENNAALTDQVRILKEEREEEKRTHAEERTKSAAEIYALTARVEAQERENDILREAIQGKADVERLVMLIQDHHHEVMEDRQSFRTEWRGEVGKVLGGMDDLLKVASETHSGVKATRAMTAKVYAATAGAGT